MCDNDGIPDNTKKRFFKVSREYMGSWISRDWDTIKDSEFDGGMDVGDSITITSVEMTEAELAALPEFEGW